MHEQGITAALLQVASHEAAGMNRVSRLVIEVGRLTSYKAASLKHYFDHYKKSHKAFSLAELTILDVPGMMRCKTCSRESMMDDAFVILCSSCGSNDTEIIAGRDIRLRKIEGT